jgi:hypothetical protein
MRRLIALMTLGVVAGWAMPAGAQVYPERIRSVTRARIESTGTEIYQRNRPREEQTERFTRTLRIGPTGELDLGNISGDIIVTRGSGDEATVEVVKHARGETVEEAREVLQLVQVDVVEQGTRAEIKARYPRRDNRPRPRRGNFNVSVSYTVTAPERARITANSISGNISVRDVKGDLALETVSGDVRIANAGRIPKAKTISGDVEIADTTIEGTMDASTVSGTLFLRKVTARRLDLHSVSGNVTLQDVECDRIDAQSVSGDVQLAGALMRGGRYDLGSHSGQVKLSLSGDVGFQLEASSFSGSVRTDLPLTLQGTGSASGRQRNRRGTFGDGSAVLDLTTFSGSIVISRR